MADFQQSDPLLVKWHIKAAHRGIAIWYFLLASICLFGRPEWFGPTWSYFRNIPHGGWGLGMANLFVGILLSYGIVRRKRLVMVAAMGMGSTALFVAAALIFAEGVVGRTGCMEAIFMAYIAVDNGIWTALLAARR